MLSISSVGTFSSGLQAGPLLLAFFILTLLLNLAIPRRLPGVPYVTGFRRWLLGDIPSWVGHVWEKGEMYTWLAGQTRLLNSPIIQVSVRPFSKPWIVIADYREMQDILTRRTKTFDRADFMRSVFSTVIPHGMITFKSDDARFQTNKLLVRGFMAPTILNEAIAPRLHKSTVELLNLWKMKAKLAQDHPFDMKEDMQSSALDALLGAIFDLDDAHSAVAAKTRPISQLGSVPVPQDADQPVAFPKTPLPAVADAIVTLTKSLAISFQSPLGAWHHWLFGQFPAMRKAYATKETMITEQIDKATERLFSGPDGTDAPTTCLLDDILQHEVMAAAKEKRGPDFKSRTVFDELFEMVIAGYETTSATAMWAFKHLSNHQAVQKRLRDELRSALPPQARGRYPTVQEILALRVPYLEAVAQETFRLALGASAHARTATEDTTLLGCAVPKGTNVFMMMNGASFMGRPFAIGDELRSGTSREAKDETTGWDWDTLGEYVPERWLVGGGGQEKEKEQAVYDPLAAPQMLFSLGPRSCFGKKMGVLSLKITLVCMVWTFELLETPENLNSFLGTEVLSRTPIQSYLKLRECVD